MSILTSKIKNLSGLLAHVAKLRSQNKRIVFTNGCFDVLHVGHVEYLSGARRLGDLLIVGLNSDSSVRKIKGKGRPVNTELDRAKVLSALSSVDYVTVFNEESPANLIKKIKPDVLVKGGDWKKKDIVGRDVVKARGGRVVTIPFVSGYSTTSVIKKIRR